MKISVELDEKKVALAKKLGRIHTLKELLDEALNVYIAQARRQTNFFEGDRITTRKKRGNVL